MLVGDGGLSSSYGVLLCMLESLFCFRERNLTAVSWINRWGRTVGILCGDP